MPFLVHCQSFQRQSPPRRQSLATALTRGLRDGSENPRRGLEGIFADTSPPSPLAVEEQAKYTGTQLRRVHEGGVSNGISGCDGSVQLVGTDLTSISNVEVQ